MPAAKYAEAAVVATVPNPKFVLAVAAFARSLKLLAAVNCKASPASTYCLGAAINELAGLPSNVNAPVNVPPANASFVAIEFVTVVAKLASSPNAAAISFNVSKTPGAALIVSEILASTYNFVAACKFAVGAPDNTNVPAIVPPAFIR